MARVEVEQNLRQQMEEFQARAERVKQGAESKIQFIKDVLAFLKEGGFNASSQSNS
jgi:uncharacterized protein (UPF0335 family)